MQSNLAPPWDWSEVWALNVSFWPNLHHRKTHHTITCLWNWYNLHQQFYARCLSRKISKTRFRRVSKSLSDRIPTMHWIETILVIITIPSNRLLGTPHSSHNTLPPTCQIRVDLLWWGKKTKDQRPRFAYIQLKVISWNLQGCIHYHTAAPKHALERSALTVWSANIWDWVFLCLFNLFISFCFVACSFVPFLSLISGFPSLFQWINTFQAGVWFFFSTLIFPFFPPLYLYLLLFLYCDSLVITADSHTKRLQTVSSSSGNSFCRLQLS